MIEKIGYAYPTSDYAEQFSAPDGTWYALNDDGTFQLFDTVTAMLDTVVFYGQSSDLPYSVVMDTIHWQSKEQSIMSGGKRSLYVE